MSRVLEVRPAVHEALTAGRPLVALESTVIAHGLPRPRNLETALEMEAAVRGEGALPATIGLLDGRVVIGLSAEEIRQLADADGVEKVSRRDLAAVLASGSRGATTVAATAWAAGRAGIPVMATGGIGGVHRGVEKTLDVSADLRELARTPVAVVCAGAKAILDLPRTLEMLETLGVPVVGYGTDDFPAFYCRDSGLRVAHRVDTPEEAARLLHAQRQLGLAAGVVFAQPPPGEEALEREEVERWIADALTAAREAGVSGSAATPFLLDQVGRRSEGRTLATNVALLLANARLAARIAVAGGSLRSES